VEAVAVRAVEDAGIDRLLQARTDLTSLVRSAPSGAENFAEDPCVDQRAVLRKDLRAELPDFRSDRRDESLRATTISFFPGRTVECDGTLSWTSTLAAMVE
jgi:hypothetical protein